MPREWVVVDTAAREIAFGELHLVLQSDGPSVWQINRWRPGPGIIVAGDVAAECAWLSPLDRSGLNLSHGPIGVAELLPDLLGRIVGIFIDPALRSLRRVADASRPSRHAEGLR